ncbi:uncharacterized protein LOC132723465 [Ruditapes philippinarum]|uniref:uncharacterized protein LOC132723465 n=1 Tax=Ruditapes philippinarum TaxID=129788 RepID=UPI00295BA99E|nr:uncharacterized protein LOC132723465 [Ruditapes philippinarum]XP_060564181.1 uncharacterized protein LOC132723465 [Ruditapes philippinarum]
MAVGGRKDPSYVSSLEHGNDFLYDYTCSLCAADGKNKEAAKFCIDCGEYLCGNCLNDHNKFPKMKSHKVVDPSEQSTICRTNQTTSIAPTITICCEKHNGKPLEMFCSDHDEVCCAVCIALYHSVCKGRYYIPDISIDFKKREEFIQQEATGQSILLDLESIKQKRQKDITLYKTQKNVTCTYFKQMREDILKQFDEIEKRSVELVEKRFQQKVANALEDITKTEEVYKTLKVNVEIIKTATNDSQAFVLAKRARKFEATSKALIQGILANKDLPFNFKMNEDVRNCLSGFKDLGHFYTASKCEVFSVQDKDEQHRCDITGICQLQNGDLVIVDAANQSIKRLGPMYIVTDKCRLSSQPWSVCNVSDTEVAVSMCNEKNIQFVSVNGKMKPSRSFRVKDTCTGLASFQDMLYVGLFNRKQIQVYDKSGFPGTTLDFNVAVPWCIAVSSDSSNIFVAAQKGGVFSFDLKNQRPVKIDVPEVKVAGSVALTANGSLIVSCQQTNCIIQYTSNGCKTLLTKADGITSPQTIFFNQKQKLIVSSKNADAIKVFTEVDQLLI